MENNNTKFQTVAINHTWDKDVFNALSSIAKRKGVNFQSLIRIAASEYLEKELNK